MEQTIFHLLQASLFTHSPVTLKEWQSTFTEMEEQAVAALPGEWLETYLPSATDWLSYCSQQQGLWVRIMHEQDELIALLEKHDIPCVIIKGSAAAVYYPHPYLRTMGDVDILVKRTDLDRAALLMEQNGYSLSLDKDHVGHHYNYTKNGISFELHKRLSIISDTEEKLLTLFEEGILHREWKVIEGYRFPMLPSALNGPVLIFHINQHLREGIGLRHIIDWMMYVNSISAEEWEDLLPMLKETGMERLALTVTAMCRKYLGLKKEIPGCDDIDTQVCDDLMAYVLEKGNFGHKAGMEGKIATVGLLSTERGSFFKRLQAGGLYWWKATKKCKILRPFAWIYQSIRIVGIFIRQRIKMKDILAYRKSGMEKRKLFDALGLTMDHEIKIK